MRRSPAWAGQALLLALLYLFLYAPIAYVIYVSFQTDSVWPFPPRPTLKHYADLADLSDFQAGLRNSLLLALGTGALSCLFATAGAIGVLRYRVPGRGLAVALYLAPLFVAHILIGIATLLFNRGVLGLPGTVGTAILANATYATAFAFLVVLASSPATTGGSTRRRWSSAPARCAPSSPSPCP